MIDEAVRKLAHPALLGICCSIAILAAGPRESEARNYLPLGAPGAVDLTVYRTDAANSVTYHYLLRNHSSGELYRFMIGTTLSSDSCPELHADPVGVDWDKARCPTSIVIPKPWQGCVNSQEECDGTFLEFEPSDGVYRGLPVGDSLAFSVTVDAADSAYEYASFWILGQDEEYEGRVRKVRASGNGEPAHRSSATPFWDAALSMRAKKALGISLPCSLAVMGEYLGGDVGGLLIGAEGESLLFAWDGGMRGPHGPPPAWVGHDPQRARAWFDAWMDSVAIVMPRLAFIGANQPTLRGAVPLRVGSPAESLFIEALRSTLGQPPSSQPRSGGARWLIDALEKQRAKTAAWKANPAAGYPRRQ